MQRKQLMKYARYTKKAMKILGLGHLDLHVRDQTHLASGTLQTDVENGVLAEISVLYPYNSIGITYYDSLLRQRPYQVRHAIAHELAHIWLAPMHHAFHKLEDLSGVSEKEYNILESQFADAEEISAEYIADQLIHLLPEFVE